MFQPENDIERVLMRATKDPAERPGFDRTIIDAEIFVVWLSRAGPLLPDANGRAVLLKGARLATATVTRGDEEFLPFFTAASRARHLRRRSRRRTGCQAQLLQAESVSWITLGLPVAVAAFFILKWQQGQVATSRREQASPPRALQGSRVR
jgi:hypothetical protein